MDLSEALEATGFLTTPCDSLRSAREALAHGSYVLIVLDVLLPDGDGLAFLQELKAIEASADIPVMLLSTEADVRDRVLGISIGADEYVGKPYDISHVVARAHELVRARYSAPTAGSKKVLVIDDSATFCEEIRVSLQSAGYDVRLAKTGEEGLALVGTTQPDAIIVDGVLPGIDGRTVVRRLKSDTGLRHIPCLLLTGSETRADELQALESGADAYLRKEEDIKVILARLSALARGASSPTAVDAGASLLGPKRLLAVDDSQTYLQELGAQLRDEGYDLVLARSGEEALQLLSAQSVDCILLDVVMPGLSGKEACRLVKESPLWRDVPVVMLTAHDDREALIQGIDAGADDYISKSSDFEVLKARLRAQLRRKHFEDENRRMRFAAQEAEHKIRALNAELERRVIERTAELEAAIKELEAFSYSVSHDLRAPLRRMHGFTRILLEEHAPELSAEAQRCLETVADGAKGMSQLVDDLLAFSRLGRQALRREVVAPGLIVRQVLKELRPSYEGRKVKLVIGDLEACDADPALLKQVFINLLSNALKFTQRRDCAEIKIGSKCRNQATVYFVKDNGAGFDMRYAGKLFGVFQRLHRQDEYEGTGVGLAIVQRIVHRHGGRVWAEAEVNRGASFFFTLETGSPPGV